MEKLVQGVHQFQADVFSPRHEFFQQLAGGQNPQALFITCSDSRMVPDLITQADPGDLFVMRNVGNMVPSYGNGSGAEAAAIEYAVKALHVKDVVICGHTKCGAVEGILDPDRIRDLPRVREWLRHADACKEVMECRYPHVHGDARWDVAVKENVLAQLENLRTHPAVAVGLSAGTLKLHGWVYDMATGHVFAYDPHEGQFRPLERTEGVELVSPVRRRPVADRRLAAAGV